MTKFVKSKQKINNNEKYEDIKNLKPVIKNTKISILVQIIGFLILTYCVFQWFLHFFILKHYRPLTFTTYITMILISLTCINKFESPFLNSFICTSTTLFIIITFLYLPIAEDFPSLFEGVILHGAIALFQIFIGLHRKISISKKYLVMGMLFYMIFITSFDSYARIKAALKTEEPISNIFLTVFIFYTLLLTCISVYFYKKKFGTLVS